MQSAIALFSAEQLDVHVCTAAEEIVHPASSTLGIHGYGSFQRNAAENSHYASLKALLQMANDICIKGRVLMFHTKILSRFAQRDFRFLAFQRLCMI